MRVGGEKMYKNLEAEMVRNDITRKDISEYIGVRYATVVQKLNGRYQFSLEEAFAIKNRFFPELDFEYLFKSDKKVS